MHFATTINIIIGVVVVVVGGVHMCITFREIPPLQVLLTVFLCISMCLNCAKKGDLCTAMHRSKISAHFMHELNTSYAQGMYCFGTLLCTFFDILTFNVIKMTLLRFLEVIFLCELLNFR